MITDFGVAKALSMSSNAEGGHATSLGVALGTPAYMAPEQATADPSVDHRADIYAFGVLAYELLTGQPPFTGRNAQNLLAAHVTETPEQITRLRSAIPPALGALVMRCLEKRAADRPQAAMDLVHSLDQINTPSGGTMPTSAIAAMSARIGDAPASSRRWLIAVPIVVLLLVGAWFARARLSGGSDARSIAVLPMDVGGDTAHAYLADGLANELTTRLTKIPGLAVRAYSSSKSMRGRGARDAGKELSVASVLTARALALDPSLAEAHAESGTLRLWYDYDSVGAAREFEQALKLDSANSTAGVWYPFVLRVALNLPDSAIAVSNRAVLLNPGNLTVLSNSMDTASLRTIGVSAAAERCRTLTRLGGVDVATECEANRQIVAGNRAEAVRLTHTLKVPDDFRVLHARLATRLATYGDRAGAERELEAALEASKHEYIREDEIATAYYRLGDREQSIAWWQKAVDSNGAQVLWLAYADEFAALRTDPRVQAMLKKAGAIK